jgi:Glycosyl transferase family 11
LLDFGSYYHPAMTYIRERVSNPKFFVFSEDFDWASANFRASDTVVVKPGQEAQDIFLMSLCSHAIIANSSFSWWAAYLGDQNGNSDRIVIAPREWFKDPHASYQDLVPERWVRL